MFSEYRELLISIKIEGRGLKQDKLIEAPIGHLGKDNKRHACIVSVGNKFLFLNQQIALQSPSRIWAAIIRKTSGVDGDQANHSDLYIL